jgi:hypothetical protein
MARAMNILLKALTVARIVVQAIVFAFMIMWILNLPVRLAY